MDMNQEFSVYIVDDQELLREGLKAVFNDVPWVRIVGEARSSQEALAFVAEHKPDLVLLDPCLPGAGLLACIRTIKSMEGRTRVMVITDHDTEDWVYECLDAGVNGYVVKNTSRHELIIGVQAVLEGKTFMSPCILNAVARGYLEGCRARNPRSLISTLTAREREVFECVGQGLKNREIAERLYISIKTVEKHRAGMMRKLKLKSPGEVRSLWADCN